MLVQRGHNEAFPGSVGRNAGRFGKSGVNDRIMGNVGKYRNLRFSHNEIFLKGEILLCWYKEVTTRLFPCL